MIPSQSTFVQPATPGEMRLAGFTPVHAPLVARWVRNAEELFWLAPSATPPLSAEKVVAWTRESGNPLVLLDESGSPIGYAELNPMRDAPSHLWIGHLVLDPAHRGQGRGEAFVRLLLDHAFNHRRARLVSLIVFPGNRSAIKCYQRAGFLIQGEQFHTFGRSSQRQRMLHLVARFRLTRPG
jgi:RimJ/RimL family protein N-acetyltransferase